MFFFFFPFFSRFFYVYLRLGKPGVSFFFCTGWREACSNLHRVTAHPTLCQKAILPLRPPVFSLAATIALGHAPGKGPSFWFILFTTGLGLLYLSICNVHKKYEAGSLVSLSEGEIERMSH